MLYISFIICLDKASCSSFRSLYLPPPQLSPGFIYTCWACWELHIALLLLLGTPVLEELCKVQWIFSCIFMDWDFMSQLLLVLHYQQMSTTQHEHLVRAFFCLGSLIVCLRWEQVLNKGPLDNEGDSKHFSASFQLLSSSYITAIVQLLKNNFCLTLNFIALLSRVLFFFVLRIAYINISTENEFTHVCLLLIAWVPLQIPMPAHSPV